MLYLVALVITVINCNFIKFENPTLTLPPPSTAHPHDGLRARADHPDVYQRERPEGPAAAAGAGRQRAADHHVPVAERGRGHGRPRGRVLPPRRQQGLLEQER